MSRYIDADALIDRMYHEAFEMDSDMQKWDSGCWIRYKMFENHLKDAPSVPAVPLDKLIEWLSNWMANMREFVLKNSTVDVAPVVRGHWTDVGYLSCRCSECGCKNDKETRFCPNCGAKMFKPVNPG